MLSVVVSFCFVFDFVSPNLAFVVNKHKIQKDMKRFIRQDLNPEDILTLYIPKSEIENKNIFKWIHSKEFRYRGAMYDLVPNYATLEDENGYVFKVVNDVKEEKLLAEFIGSFSGSPYSMLLKNIKSFVFDAVSNYQKIRSILYVNPIDYKANIFKILSNYVLIESPPPEFKTVHPFYIYKQQLFININIS